MSLVAETIALLDELEWSGRGDWGDACCPCCRGYQDGDDDSVGHRPDCKLAALRQRAALDELSREGQAMGDYDR